MKRALAFVCALASTLVLEGPARAITVATDPVGFANLSLPTSSDSYISVPFTRPAAFVGAISSVSANTITLAGTPNFTPNGFVYAPGNQPNHYYALIGNGGSSNPKEGHTFLITSNGSNTLTVDTTIETLTGITQNTQVTVIPYWTVGTVFPSSDAGTSYTASTSSASPQTQISVPDENANGTNLPNLATYYFSNNVDNTSSNIGWRKVGDANTTPHDDDILLPDSYFVVHNPSGTPAGTLTTLGAVLTKKLSIPLKTQTGAAQDNPAAIVRPLDVPLSQTGLNPGDGSFVAGDQLLVFNNSVAASPKTPAIYYRDPATNNTWHLQGDTRLLDHGDDVIPLGTGIIVRKAGTAAAIAARSIARRVAAPSATSFVFWTNSFPVQATAAVSRKTHGTAGAFDLPLPVTGAPGIESRSGPYQIVMTFPTAVTFTGATNSFGSASLDNATGSGTNTVTLNISSVTNAQYATFTLSNVSDGVNTNDVQLTVGFLVGDANGDGFVNSGDATVARNLSGQTANASNFRDDFNFDGFINSADATIARNNSGQALH